MDFPRNRFLRKWSGMENGRFMDQYWSDFDKNGAVETLRSRRIDRCHFYHTAMSFEPRNGGVFVLAIMKEKT